MISFMTWLYVISFGMLMIVTFIDRFKKYRIYIKLMTSLGFLVIAVLSAIEGDNKKLYVMMLIGFIFCIIGDGLLAITDDRENKKYLVAGMMVFLAAHVSFIVAFQKLAGISIYEFIIPVAVLILTERLTHLKDMQVENMYIHILVYSFFVSFLFSKSIGVMYVMGLTKGTLLAVTGAGLFLLSDGIIMFLYFYKKKYKIIRFFNLLTYYGATYFLACSLKYL